VVIIGIAGAAFGIWFMMHSRPTAGTYVDAVALDETSYIAVRAQDGTDRNFIDVVVRDQLKWQALIPHYAGRVGAPAIGVARDAMTVRIARTGHSEVFGMSLLNASKLGSLQLGKDRPDSVTGHCGEVITLTADGRSFELISSDGNNAIAAIDVSTGLSQWQKPLGATPIVDAGVDGTVVWVKHVASTVAFNAVDGSVAAVPAAAQLSDRRAAVRNLAVGVTYTTATRQLRISNGAGAAIVRSWPLDAAEPWPYHVAGQTILLIRNDRIEHLQLTPEIALTVTK
jgi:hypothetical protein